MLISNAYAQAAGAAGGIEQQVMSLLPIVLMFVVLYFLMVRPQMKRAKEHRQMVEALQKGDEVITSGGIVGRLSKVSDAYVTVEVAQAGANAVEMTVQKQSVQMLLPKGTIKAL